MALGGPGKNQREAADILRWTYIVIGVATIVSALGMAAVAWIDGGMFAGPVAVACSLLVVPGALWLLVGLSLGRRRYWWYCFVIGVLTIPVAIPVGTALGIWTILILNRSDVRAAFRHGQTDVSV